MEKIKKPFETTATEKAETFWKNFEKTGSVGDYLKFVETAKKNSESFPPSFSSWAP